jgi:hypothetical protein
MNSQQLIDKLGYKDSSAFLQGERLKEHYGYSFFFTHAEKKKHCNLKGVYTLLDSPDKLVGSSLTPVVYVCEADNEAQAEEIHKRVWNQNIVPFLIVVTPKNIRFYSGFEYDKKSDEERLLDKAKDVNEVLSRLSEFKAKAIDSGDIWKQRPISVEGRVDRHLLEDLKKLSKVLTDENKDYKLPIEHAHTLIGKYIYLKYLRDRGILSDKRLSDAGVDEKDIFSGTAGKEKLDQLETFLDGFLNGSVFPLPSRNYIQTKHVQKVAGVFEGDAPESGQQVLFNIYDFSYVPIETLSVVYQQFLHAKGQGRGKGAYYTPVHLVNFILDELDAKKPLKEGMKVFDPSCGSGAFLVQCYRRLVEKVARNRDDKLKPTELRKLLVDHIFGLDADEKACQVAELSLSLTLLDYIDPPDLSKTRFQLPNLHNKNIFHCEGGFFDEDSSWAKCIPKKGYDWIVGNPPWKNKEKYGEDKLYDQKALHWINTNRKQYPVDNYQTAEAFAWKTTELLAEDGQCGLLMPALTLFKKQGDKFRTKFFSEIETWCIVNFANIRRYLFEGAINPAAAFFYSGKKDWDKSEHYITTYAPFAVEQDSQLYQKGRSKKFWSVFVNYSTIKEIPIRDVENGSAVPWKTAMWGTHRDKCLLDIISRRYDDILAFKSNRGLLMNQGPEFRPLPTKTDSETPEGFEAKLKKFKDNHEYLSKYVGKYVLDTDKVHAGCFHLPDDPDDVYKIMGKDDVYLRTRGGKAGLELFKAPHIIISASRSFSVYSDVDFMVPPRQIGIAGDNIPKKLLKALALYLNSEFVRYQQWLTSAAWGIERDRPNLADIKRLPMPLSVLSDVELTKWAKLHDEIVVADKLEREFQQDRKTLLFNSPQETSLPSLNTLLKRMNGKVYNLLGISKKQQWLIEDMLGVRMKLNDGKIAKEARNSASKEEIADFAHIFQEELDLFLDHTGKKKVHKVRVLYTDSTGIMIVDHLVCSMATKPEVVKVQDDQTRRELNKLQGKLTETRSQWMYFTRCLQIHEARRTYIFKPRQRLYWLKSQALAEADDFIAEKLTTDK